MNAGFGHLVFRFSLYFLFSLTANHLGTIPDLAAQLKVSSHFSRVHIEVPTNKLENRNKAHADQNVANASNSSGLLSALCQLQW